MDENYPLPPADFNLRDIESPRPVTQPVSNEPVNYPVPPSDFNLSKIEGERIPPTFTKDIGLGAASGLSEGAVGLLGTVGGFGQAYDYLSSLPSTLIAHGAEKLGLLPEGKTANDLIQAAHELHPQSEEERQGYVNKIAGVPVLTPSGAIAAAKATGMPTYEPQTIPGQLVKAGTAAIPQAALVPGSIASKLTTSIGSGVTSELGGQAFKGTSWETPARVAGSFLGAGAGQTGVNIATMMSPQKQAENARRIAGQVMREAFPVPEETQTALEQHINPATAPSVLPGVEPTTAQVLRTPQATQLERKIENMGTRVSSDETQKLQDIRNKSQQEVYSSAGKIPELIEAGMPKVDMAEAFGLPANAQNEASIAAKSNILSVENQMSNAENAAWDAFRESGGVLDKKIVIKQLYDAINDMDPVLKRRFPTEIAKDLEAVARAKGPNGVNTIDPQTLQNLRSFALSTARKAALSPQPVNEIGINNFANKIADIMQEPASYVSMGENPETWNAARSATRTYQKMFGSGIANDIISDTVSGAPKVSGEATFSRMFQGPNAAENLRQVRAIPGVNIDNNVSDWMIGKLTQGGTKVGITSDEINRFMSDPKNQAIISQIPGLSDRISNIAQQAGESATAAQYRQVSNRFKDVLQQNNPKSLANFIDKNGDLLKEATQNEDFINQLGNSARFISSLPAKGNMSGIATLQQLENNNILSILYGRAVGAISDSAAGALAGHITGLATGFSGLSMIAGAVGFLKGKSGVGQMINDSVNKFLTGTTRSQAIEMLQLAAQDPTFAHMLMSSPSPERINSIVGYVANQAATSGAKAAILAPHQLATGQSTGGRIERASGGRAGLDHKSAAEALMRAAERAKKAENETTEPLLNLPDEAITKALSAANEAI